MQSEPIYRYNKHVVWSLTHWALLQIRIEEIAYGLLWYERSQILLERFRYVTLAILLAGSTLVHFLKTSYASAFVPGTPGSSLAPEATLERGAPRRMHKHFCGDTLGSAPWRTPPEAKEGEDSHAKG